MNTPEKPPVRPSEPRTPVPASTETPGTESEAHRGAQRIRLDDLTSNQLDILYDLLETLIAAAQAREADREEARDALETAGHPSAHVDDWPRIAPAVHALITERDALHGRLKAARALHKPMQRGGLICAHCSGWDGFRCRSLVQPYPCPTLRALDGPPQLNPDTTQETR